MRRFILIIASVLLLLLSVSGFSMSNALHTSTSREILKMMFGKAPSTKSLMNLHRFMDVAPGRSYVGGAYHRYLWGHDAKGMNLTVSKSDLPARKAWTSTSIHVLQDSKTPAGVPKSGFYLARKTMLRYYMKAMIKPLLKYGLFYGMFEMAYRIMEGQSWKEAGIGSAVTTSIYLGSSAGISYLAFRFVPASIVKSPVTFALFSRITCSVPFFIADLAYRWWETKSFKKALLSPQTAIIGSLVTLSIFYPTATLVGVTVYAAVYATYVLIDYLHKRFVSRKYEAFESALFDALQRNARKVVEAGM